jgi:competence protein ComEC
LVNQWRNIPVLRILIPFLVGVFIQMQFDVTVIYWLGASLFLICILGVFVFWKGLKGQNVFAFGVLAGLLFFFMGGALCVIRTPIADSRHFSHFGEAEFLDCVINTTPEQGLNSFKTKALVQAVLVNGEITQTKGDILLYITHKSNVQLNKGDRILLAVTPVLVEGPQNPDEFNYRRYLFFHGLYHRVMISDNNQVRLIEENYQTWWVDPFERMRKKLVATLRQALTDDNAFAVGSALILGQKEYLSPELRNAYSSSGAMHVLAVSGLHVGIIYLILQQFLSFIKGFKGDKWLQLILILVALWTYAIITGMSPSVLRASTMFSAVAISQSLGRKSGIYNSLSAAALILLCFDPYMITEVGFQLSFAAVIGIVLFQPPIYNLVYVRNKWLDKVWQITCVSLAAQLITFPMGVLYFHQFPNYFLVSNLIVIPAAFVVLVVGSSLLALQFIPVVFQLLGFELNGILVALNSSVAYIEHMPYALTSGLYFSIFEVWMVYIIIAALVLFVYQKDIHALMTISASVLLLLFSFSIRVKDRKAQKTIVVNNIKGHTSINLIDGEKNILFADSALIASNSKQVFHLKNFWYRLGYKEATYIDLADTTTLNLPGLYRCKNFLSFHGYTLAINPEKGAFGNSENLPPIDLLVMSGKSKVEDYPTPVNEVILSSGYRYRNICCAENADELAVIDVRKTGAWMKVLR